MKEMYQRLGRPNAFTWQVAAVALLPSVLLVLAGPWARAGGSPLPWIAFALSGSAIATFAMVPFRATILQPGDRPTRPALTLFAFALAGMIRGVVIGQLAHADGRLPDPQVGQRLFGGSIAGVVYLAIIALMVQSIRDHADSSRQLAREKARLVAVTEASRTELERVSAEIVERVRGQMIIRLEAIVATLTTAGSQLAGGAAAIAGLIDSTLKPLVDEITKRPAQLNLATLESELAPSGKAMGLFNDTTIIKPISPEATALAIALAGSASFIPLAGPLRMVAAAVMVGLGLVVIMRIAEAPMRWAGRTLGPLGRAIVLTLLLELAGLTVTALVLVLWNSLGLQLDPQIHTSLLAASPVVVVFVGWGIAVTAAWNRRADEMDSELAAAVESLRAQDQRLAREVVVERDRLAKFVHGPVQAHLIAAWGMLERRDQELPSDSDLVAAAAQIGQAIQILEERITRPDSDLDGMPSVTDLVSSYARVWEGLVEINCSVDSDAQSRLTQDPSACMATGEVIREGIANAARHARSERIHLSVTSTAAESVCVVVDAEARPGLRSTVNEGHGPSARRGLGSSNLDQLTESWQLEILDSGSRLTAVIAVSPEPLFA